MNLISRTITGIFLMLVALGFVIIAFISNEGWWVFSIEAIVAFIVGLFILFNKKEDQIEARKDLNKKRTRK